MSSIDRPNLAAIEARDLTVTYGGGVRAVKGVNLRVEPGQILALVGPNGCGKSSLLKAIAKVIPSEGTVTVGGKDMGELSRRERVRCLSYVPQMAEMDVDLTAREIVRLGVTAGRGLFGKSQEGDEERVTHALGHVSLLDKQHARWSELSGGQRQRLSIARALAQEADIILLDEPTNHLDIEHQMLLVDLLAHVVQDHKSAAVVVLHDLGLAARMADVVAVMYAGEIKTFGNPADALRRPTIEEFFRVQAEVVYSDADGAALMIENRLPESAE